MCPDTGRGFIRWTGSAGYYDADGRLVHVEGDDEYPATRAELDDDLTTEPDDTEDD